MIHQAQRNQQGVTLIELVISIVVISIAMVALLNAFSVSINQSADPLWRNKTLKLAQLYMDEILAQRYDDTTPVGGLPAFAGGSCDTSAETGETRTTYDDVGDYNNINNESPPETLDGPLTDEYPNYSVSVDVVCAGTEVGASGNNHAKRITLSITAPTGDTLTFSAYRGNF